MAFVSFELLHLLTPCLALPAAFCPFFLRLALSLRAPQVDLERTQDDLLDDVHQRIRKAKVDGGLVPPNPSKGKSSDRSVSPR